MRAAARRKARIGGCPVLAFGSRKALAIGEAMIEMADVGNETYRRGFAGDTFNTAWHMAQLLGDAAEVGFVTKVGMDSVSDAFVEQSQQDGLDVSGIGRSEARTMGLYMIELDGVERSFQYWRDTSAARLLADDLEWLEQAVTGAGLIHLSGITLAILSEPARETLFEALTKARAQGAIVSFDPNVRPRLWRSAEETRAVLARFNTLTDIALPSFDDESALWGEESPVQTVERLRRAGVVEIAVKNGAAALTAFCDDHLSEVPTQSVDGVRDTSGAGDAFNAGYLSARFKGCHQEKAVHWGQRTAGEVIRHFGARIPKDRVPEID
nr:sugar kinase [Ruegeria lacuscaerulensis]